MKHKTKYLFTILTVIFILFSFAGCKTDKQENINDDILIIPERDNEEHELIFVCPIIDNSYWLQCIDGMKLADAELGSNTTVIGPKTGEDFKSEIANYMKQAIDKNPDGIFAYASLDVLQPYIEEAANKGIPVIAIDADATSEARLAYVGTDLYKMGYLTGETMIEYISDESKIGYICTSKSLENERTLYEAFLDAVADRGIKVVKSLEGDNNIETSYEQTKILLNEYPDIKGIFCTGGYNVAGAAKYLEEIGRNDIVLIGFEDVEENLDYLSKGIIKALVCQNPYEMGYIASFLMNEYLETGNLASNVYNTDSIIVTLDNIDVYKTVDYSPDYTLKEVKIGFFDDDSSFYNENEDGRKVGLGYEYMQMIATIAGWKYQYTFDSHDKLIEMIENGDLDMVIGSYKVDGDNESIKLSANDIGVPTRKRYIGVSASRIDLLNELNGAMLKLDNEETSYITNLYEKYYENEIGNYALIESERAYIAAKKEISFGYLKDNLPFSDVDENGSPTGLIKDVMNYIANFTNIPIRPIVYDSIESLNIALQNKEVDVAFPGYSDVWINEQNHFRQTEPFVSDRIMIIYSGEYSDDLLKRVAIHKEGIGQKYFINSTYPEAVINVYEKREEVFEAIYNGEERCTIGYSSILQRFLYLNPKYEDLHVAYLDSSFELGLIVNEEDSYLVSVLNKTLNSMGSNAINSSILSYAGVEKEPTTSNFIRANSLMITAFFVLILAMILMLLMFNIQKDHKFRKMQEAYTKELEGALEEAKKANQAKTKFLSSMSHDIRTPMNAIMGMTTIALSKDEEGKNIRDYLLKIKSSGSNLLALINDVLDISKIESGVAELNPMEFSVIDSMNILEHVFSQSASEKSIEFKMNVDCDEDLIVYADKVRFEQVIVNLTSNAIKYTPSKGKVNCYLKLTEKEENKGHITFIVEDTGIGMSKEFIDVMYESFTRAKDTRINEIQGTGLGLAIVKQVVDMMEGTIVCESTEGKGTKFTVDIDVDVLRRKMDTVSETSKISIYEGINALVTEDNELNWEVISELLAMNGISSARATNGKECIDMLLEAEPNTYTIVLMDIQMPVMNGRDATKWIRVNGREDFKDIPILAMTADAFAEDIKACLEVGMNGHVAKPINIDNLLQEIVRVTAKKEN